MIHVCVPCLSNKNKKDVSDNVRPKIGYASKPFKTHYYTRNMWEMFTSLPSFASYLNIKGYRVLIHLPSGGKMALGLSPGVVPKGGLAEGLAAARHLRVAGASRAKRKPGGKVWPWGHDCGDIFIISPPALDR